MMGTRNLWQKYGCSSSAESQCFGIPCITEFFRRFPRVQSFQTWLFGNSPNNFSGENQPSTLWLFNIAMENCPFIDGLPIKHVIFHGELLNNQRVNGWIFHCQWFGFSPFWIPRILHIHAMINSPKNLVVKSTKCPRDTQEMGSQRSTNRLSQPCGSC